MARRALLGAALALVLAGCGGPRTVQVQVQDGMATLASGEALRVDLGDVNASIGDSWYLVGPPDPAILSEGTTESEVDCDQPGCGAKVAWVFMARGKGTTTLTFRYCYRSGPADCLPQTNRGPDHPVALTVTVT